ncbi:hypothetical protein CTheo_4772 [Ceratobasidium theobromae]|uniref:Uncharacterized protein n=1 Tax=Ceratobasidium theobromae TaxID=1582974 RepID=A0A5N5QJ62_9AGAM|nr:hypothetical protein CTheo_4772 [Ceratobasidium theobromae]
MQWKWYEVNKSDLNAIRGSGGGRHRVGALEARKEKGVWDEANENLATTMRYVALGCSHCPVGPPTRLFPRSISRFQPNSQYSQINTLALDANRTLLPSALLQHTDPGLPRVSPDPGHHPMTRRMPANHSTAPTAAPA